MPDCSSTFKLGMGQMLVEGGSVDANLRRAEKMIADAAGRECRIIVLPECLDVGWTHPKARELAQPVPGPTSDLLCAAAKQHRIHVAAGLTEQADGKLYNTAILIAPDGEILLKHRKINVLDIAQDVYAIGNMLGVAETELGVIGLNICADNFPDSLVFAHALARMGAQLIVSPCAWAVPADYDNEATPYGDLWHRAYGEFTARYDVTIVGVSNVGPVVGGPWDGRKCIGCSLAMGPGSEVLCQAAYGETAETLEVIDVALAPRQAAGTDWPAALRKRGYEGI